MGPTSTPLTGTGPTMLVQAEGHQAGQHDGHDDHHHDHHPAATIQ
jgi:hypothetical protein